MAKLLLNRLWINLVETGASLSAYSDREKTLERSVNGAVQTFAGGRQRSISSVGVKGTLAFKLRVISQGQLDLLESWIAQTVVVRDDRGRRWFGVYYGVSISNRSTKNLYDVSITLDEVTYSEGI